MLYLQTECEEYKNIVAKPASGGNNAALDEGFRTYDCGTFGFRGLIVGGTKAKPGEFPHMAGENSIHTKYGNIELIESSNYSYFPQQSDTKKSVDPLSKMLARL